MGKRKKRTERKREKRKEKGGLKQLVNITSKIYDTSGMIVVADGCAPEFT